MDNPISLKNMLSESSDELKQSLENALTESEMLCEMAEVGRVGKYVVFVWSRDGGEIPHFHVGDASTYPRCTKFSAAIKIEVAEYFPHGGHYTDRFNSKETKALANFLKKEVDGDTNWEFIRKAWNRGTSNHKVAPSHPMPDYTKLH